MTEHRLPMTAWAARLRKLHPAAVIYRHLDPSPRFAGYVRQHGALKQVGEWSGAWHWSIDALNHSGGNA